MKIKIDIKDYQANASTDRPLLTTIEINGKHSEIKEMIRIVHAKLTEIAALLSGVPKGKKAKVRPEHESPRW